MSDLISRQDAIDAVLKRQEETRGAWYGGMSEAVDVIDALPSAEAVHKPDYSYEAGMVRRMKEALSADRPTGEWKGYNADNPDWLRKDGTPIFLVCDKCHGMVLNNGSANWNFCPNCGARMEGGDDE